LKEYRNVILISFSVFLIGVSAFSVISYIISLSEKNALVRSLEEVRQEVSNLEYERVGLVGSLQKERQLSAQLSGQNVELKENLKNSEENLSKLESELIATRRKVQELDKQLASLRETKEYLTLTLAQTSQEKESLLARMNSVVELKKAIRDLKRKMRKPKPETQAPVRKAVEHQDAEVLGNQGFLVKDGKSTYPQRVRIDVQPIVDNR
jgi:chromosome segregation ATPase